MAQHVKVIHESHRGEEMRKQSWFAIGLAALAAVVVVGTLTSPTPAPAQGEVYSVWLVESSRFMGVPFGAFMPDRAFVPGSTSPMNNINTVDLPVNVGVIKGGKDVILYDSGWKQQDYFKMTLGGLSYKLGELDRAGLKARIEGSTDTYRRAGLRIAVLTPPASLARAHEMYSDAVRLYQQSAAEMLRVVGDGRDEHLVAAHPLSMEASEKLLKVGDILWPSEYKPN